MKTDTSIKSLQVVEKELSPWVKEAREIVITTPKEMESAANLLARLKKLESNITMEKEKITKPLNEALKAERGRWKPLEDQLTVAISAIRTKAGQYQIAEEKRAEAEEKAIADRVGEGKGHLKPETAMRKMDEIDRPAAAIDTGAGTLKFRKDFKLKVTDISTLLFWLYNNEQTLLDYDQAAVLKLLKDGRKIRGVELEEVRIPVNSRA